MCIFSQPIMAVNNTHIFARLSGQGTQFLAYQMNYESRGENAMILPVPVKQPAREESLRFISLQAYEQLFRDLDRGFPYHHFNGIGCAAHDSKAVTDSYLKVHDVGNYIASFVPALADFSRLDERFRLPEETWTRLPGYVDFGFAVFQLAAGTLRPHPMAFEFETRTDQLFFPTVHVHDGQVHADEEFDHVLYMQHAGFDSRVSSYLNADINDPSTGWVRSKFNAEGFCRVGQSCGLIAPELLVHRQILHGLLSNQDTLIVAHGDPLKVTFNFRRWIAYSPWLLAMAAIGWLFRRRALLKRLRG